jgi:hypothetical protein
MGEQTQMILDETQRYVEEASRNTYSGPGGTRVLQGLVAMLARQYLTAEQQQQIEKIINIHEICLNQNGQSKNFD